jgi:hypothetical protein
MEEVREGGGRGSVGEGWWGIWEGVVEGRCGVVDVREDGFEKVSGVRVGVESCERMGVEVMVEGEEVERCGVLVEAEEVWVEECGVAEVVLEVEDL